MLLPLLGPFSHPPHHHNSTPWGRKGSHCFYLQGSSNSPKSKTKGTPTKNLVSNEKMGERVSFRFQNGESMKKMEMNL